MLSRDQNEKKTIFRVETRIEVLKNIPYVVF